MSLFARIHGKAAHTGHVLPEFMEEAHNLQVCCECCPKCRPDDYPPHDEPRMSAEIVTDRVIRVSPWVQRAQRGDLPTFDRHNGAHAFTTTRSN